MKKRPIDGNALAVVFQLRIREAQEPAAQEAWRCAFYEAAMAAPLPDQSWVRTKDEEPPDGEWVLGWREGYIICMIYDRDYDGEAMWTGDRSIMPQAPTHWTTLLPMPTD